MNEHSKPYRAPRLTLRVGVTGHRPCDLGDANAIARMQQSAEYVLSALAGAMKTLHTTYAYVTDDAPDLRLVTAIAEGADRFVADAAVRSGYRLNLILPFPRETYKSDFKGDARVEYCQYLHEGNNAVSTCTELDVSTTPHDTAAYVAAGEVTLAHSDVVIAVWNEKDAKGPGGTAEVVREALRRGLTTVLITLDGQIKLWSAPDTTVDPLADGAWISSATESWGQVDAVSLLLRQVRKQFEAPNIAIPAADRDEDEEREKKGENKHDCDRSCDDNNEIEKGESTSDWLRQFQQESFQPTTLTSSYELVCALLLPTCMYGEYVFPISTGLDRERKEAWCQTSAAAESIGGADYRKQINTKLRDRWIGADNLAIYYSHLFRSAFITNFALAAFAVFVGLVSVLYWDSKLLKAICVIGEITLITAILVNTRMARKHRWRERWLDYRSLAETLRPARLPLIIGGSPLRPSREAGSTQGQQWIAWYARMSLREIEPPNAVIGPGALRQALDVAYVEEMEEQLRYHRKNIKRLNKLDHRLEQIGDAALFGTVISCVLFLATFALYKTGYPQFADLFKPIATLLGATLPVIGAAVFGIRATGDFRSAVQQSRRMVRDLKRFKELVEAHREFPSRPVTSAIFSQLSRSLSDDLRIWGMVYSERELVAGF